MVAWCVIAAPGSVPHCKQFRSQHLQPLCPMCWGGAWPFKVSPPGCPFSQPQPPLEAQAPIPHFSFRYEKDTVTVHDLGNIFTRLPIKRMWHQVHGAWASCQRGGVGQGREAKTLTLCLLPRHCSVPGTGCTWTPPAPTPQPPPPTSITLSCGRPSTSPSNCPAGTCASEVSWPLVVRGVAGC